MGDCVQGLKVVLEVKMILWAKQYAYKTSQVSNNKETSQKQVNILISKNQALQS